ncbi:MAG: DUF2029 domain-containing protein [Candidatus Auribacter fodinae]|uniref:DUF2029 domain-containing protein n=1 Tax=Candidatus Auribacter fodinae TaxID=2093366 RepID=A0A3A4R3D7_9BACT|nr:MAG: DUF2029 domain-containing protein [Candidatus Auribacter fodinae]
MRAIHTKTILIIATIISWSVFITCSFVIGRHPMGDFSPVYLASKLTNYSRATRLHMYDHSSKQFNATDSKIIKRLAKKEGIIADTYTPYVYPPFFAWQMKPLTYLQYWDARIIMLILLFFSITGGTYFSYKAMEYQPSLKWFLLLAPILLLCFFPVHETIHLGQSTALVLLLLALGLYLIHRNRFVWAGICFGYCVCLKISPLLIVFALTACGLFTTILSALATVALLIGGGALFFGSDLTARYLSFVAEISKKGTMPAWNNLSIQGTLLRFTRPLSGIVEWVQQPVPLHLMVIEKAVLFILFAAGSATIAYYVRRGKENSLKDKSAINYVFSFALILMLLSAPISWNHYHLYTIIPMMLVLSELLKIREKKFRIYLIITLVLSYLLMGIDPKFFAFFIYEGESMQIDVGLGILVFSIGIFGILLLYCLLCISLIIRTRRTATPQQGEIHAQQHDQTMDSERADYS